jgi:hypothetical protein
LRATLPLSCRLLTLAAQQNRPDPRVLEARKSLAPITKKLDGLVRKRDMDWTPPCSVNNAVDALIRDATSSSLLAQMCESAAVSSSALSC